jgi:hypothetical protein
MATPKLPGRPAIDPHRTGRLVGMPRSLAKGRSIEGRSTIARRRGNDKRSAILAQAIRIRAAVAIDFAVRPAIVGRAS